MPKLPCVAVLLATFNGEEFLAEQLQSLKNQVDVCIHLYIQDDGSSDRTIEILKEFDSFPISLQVQDSKIGPAAVFKNLLLNPDLLNFEYIAFCDQDDVWNKQKLQRAIEVLRESSEIMLYSSKRMIRKGNCLKPEKYPKNDLKIESTSLLFENKCYGNTIVFKKKNLLDIEDFVSRSGEMPHDFLMARIALMNGQILVDSKAYIEYRIHQRNHTGLGARFRIFYVRIRKYPGRNNYFLKEYFDLLNLNQDTKTLKYLLKMQNNKFMCHFNSQAQLRFSKVEDCLFKLFLFFGYLPEIKRSYKS